VAAQERGPLLVVEDAGATLEIIPDAGHFPHWEQPEAFVSRLTAFADGTGG